MFLKSLAASLAKLAHLSKYAQSLMHKVYKENGIPYGPARAANAGGVAVSAPWNEPK